MNRREQISPTLTASLALLSKSSSRSRGLHETIIPKSFIFSANYIDFPSLIVIAWSSLIIFPFLARNATHLSHWNSIFIFDSSSFATLSKDVIYYVPLAIKTISSIYADTAGKESVILGSLVYGCYSIISFFFAQTLLIRSEVITEKLFGDIGSPYGIP